MKKKAFAVVLTLLLWLGAFSAYAVLAAPTNDGSGESTPLEVPAEGLAFENGHDLRHTEIVVSRGQSRQKRSLFVRDHPGGHRRSAGDKHRV